MITLSLAQVADIVGGALRDPAAGGRVVRGVGIDSRVVGDGDLFVALAGTRTDGHRFVDAAVAAGAAGALVEQHRLALVDPAAPVVVVDDTTDALQALGAWMRETVDPVVVGITGSNGKTTTKDLVAAAAADLQLVASPGSFNNELGVPLTCCRLRDDSELLVCELAMRGMGHIAELAALVRPTIGIVTSVAAVHLELLGSIEAIARAKRELVEALPPDGVAVLSADDARVAAMAGHTAARVTTFGRSPSADWHAEAIELDADARARFVARTPHGRAKVTVPVPGLHNVGNALAALAAAVEAGVELEAAAAGIAQARVSPWRLQLQVVGGVRVLNDAYNANPTSTTAALRTLAQLPTDGRRWAVLGTMAEIGPTSGSEHRAVGHAAAELDINGLIAVGGTAAAMADGANAADPDGAAMRWTVDDVDAAAERLAAVVRPGDVVLVKASRSAGLERVVDRLAALLGDDTGGVGERGA